MSDLTGAQLSTNSERGYFILSKNYKDNTKTAAKLQRAQVLFKTSTQWARIDKSMEKVSAKIQHAVSSAID